MECPNMARIVKALSEEVWDQVSFLFEPKHSYSEDQPHP